MRTQEELKRFVLDAIARKGTNLSAAALGIGRSRPYLHNWINHGIPRKLDPRDMAKLAKYLGVEYAEMVGEPESPPVINQPGLKNFSTLKFPFPEDTFDFDDFIFDPHEGERISEVDVTAAAGLTGAIRDEDVKAAWEFPSSVVCDELHAEPENLIILRVSGASGEPAVHHNDRVLVDRGQTSIPEEPEEFGGMVDGETHKEDDWRHICRHVARMLGYYVVQFAGEPLVKRALATSDGRLRVLSQRPFGVQREGAPGKPVGPWMVETVPADAVRVIGKVVYLMRRVR